MERLERYISTAWKYGIACMIVFGNDCMPPKSEFWKPLKLGEQTYDWGYHGGRKHSQHAHFNAMGYHLLDEPEIAERHYQWVREIMEKYKNDERVVMWDMYNEPGNSNREPVTMKHVTRFFEIAREVNPSQPITSAVWRCDRLLSGVLPESHRYCLENSDIISYHSYSNYETNVRVIKALKELGRPMINSEWLGRCLHNTVQEMYPLFYLEKIGCYNWGFVAGKYQTYEPWEGTWQQLETDPDLDVDFTKWFHDLYRPNHRPYDPKEIALIQQFCALADADHARTQNIG
jgi:hypothetical protein